MASIKKNAAGEIQYWDEMFAIFNLDTRQMVASRLSEDEAIEEIAELEKEGGNYELFNAVEYNS